MEEKLKEIIAAFLKMAPEAVSRNTVIDRSTLGSSILLHRLYASFLSIGVTVTNYNAIRTYGDLLTIISTENHAELVEKNSPVPEIGMSNTGNSRSILQTAVGIDIEEVESFEKAADYRDHPFYQNNFTPAEISYCLMQANTIVSLAGLFAAKEAMVKADNRLQGTPFSKLEINHDNNGKPLSKNFSISISHTSHLASAIAVRSAETDPSQNFFPAVNKIESTNRSNAKNNYLPVLVKASLIISISSILLCLYLFFHR